LLTAVDRQAEVSRLGAYQIRRPLLCASEQQGRWKFTLQHKTGNDGGTSGCDQVRAQASAGRGDYTLSATPTLVYQDSSTPKTFTGSEILTDQTGLGMLVSVALVLTIDVGGERFGVFLPQLDLTPGQSIDPVIKTIPEERQTKNVYADRNRGT
jgi:hypothetical protein